MEFKNILLIGGSGFVGRHVAHLLSECGCNVTVPTRRRERARHLLLLPTVDVVEANVQDEKQLAQLVSGQDAVINLVGILHGRSGTSHLSYGGDFARAHVELPRRIAAACHQAGVKRLLHMSALKAGGNAPSEYLRSKGDGEAAVSEWTNKSADGMEVTIFRPSVIFGAGDSFLNLFARLLRWFPLMPLGGATARFQPVFVEDVARCIVDSLQCPASFGKTYELCGPRVYTLRELVEYVGALTGHSRPVIALPGILAYMQAALLEFAPGKLMSRDNLRSMQVDNVCAACPLPFGLQPTPLEAVAPAYLAAHFPRARYQPFRASARR